MSPHDPITGTVSFTSTSADTSPGHLAGTLDISGDAATLLRQAVAGPTEVTLARAASPATQDQALWIAIRNRVEAISFPRYAAFIQNVLCEGLEPGPAACGGGQGAMLGSFGSPGIEQRRAELMSRPSIFGADAYQLLKLATQAFLAFEGGTSIEPPRYGGGGDPTADEALRLGRPITLAEAREQLEAYLGTQIGTVGGRGLPYLKRVVDALIPPGARAEGSPFCEHTLRNRLHCPAMCELIFDYWQEQAGLMQAVNAVLLRFQNRRRSAQDPLVNLAIDTLQPLSNLIWGRLQDEPQHLSVLRRAYAYQYDYGLELHGRAVGELKPVESRTQFIEAFHTLLHKAAQFYVADADTTIVADGFQMLHALKDLHMVLAESFNNQSAEITRQARVETLIDQYLLSRKEMRDFLRGRVMVPYPQAWMPQLQSMNRLQGWWPNLGVSNFHILASTAEQLLLSVRYGDWTATIDQAAAVNWARYWKPELRNYLHAYAAISGVDLAQEPGDPRSQQLRNAQPALLLRRRALAAPRQAAPASPTVETDETLEYAAPPAHRPRIA
jgi:hypothetical protein